MSYSFSARAPSKVLLLELVSSNLQAIASAQPMHSHDRKQAYDAIEGFVNVLPNVDGKDFIVTVSGSVGDRKSTRLNSSHH